MVISRITDLDLPLGVTHEATDWQISTDLLFSNVILESTYDQTNLTYIVFPDTLDTEMKYYGRARVVLSTGYSEWGNINVFVAKDINDIAIDSDYPSIISLPVITTDSDTNNHKPTLFNINATGFGVIGTGTHVATTWYITDIDNKVIWHSIHDNNNLDTIAFSKKILDENSIYRIHVIFHASSGDSSQATTKTIHVNKKDDRVILQSDIQWLDLSVDNNLILKYVDSLESATWKISEIVDGYEDVVFEQTVTTEPITDVTLPANTLELNKFYLLAIDVVIAGVAVNTLYKVFTTYR